MRNADPGRSCELLDQPALDLHVRLHMHDPRRLHRHAPTHEEVEQAELRAEIRRGRSRGGRNLDVATGILMPFRVRLGLGLHQLLVSS